MQCPDKGTWQAYLDDEVSATEKATLEQHLESCPQCQATTESLSDLATWSADTLTRYQTLTDNIAICDINRKTNRQHSKRSEFWMKRSFKKWTAIAASVAVLAGALTFAPVQDAVADLLSIFRVQKIETVKISPAELNQMAREIEAKVGQVDLQQFGEVEFDDKIEPQVLSIAEAKNAVGFELKTPAFVPETFGINEKVTVIQENTAEFKLNVEQVNAMLKGLGAKTLLPEALSGKTFTIKTPDGVSMSYQNSDATKHFNFTQYNSPEIKVPDGVNPNVLRTALLDLPILPEDLRTQLAAIDDWQSTMIIPEAEDSEIVTVAGNDAVFTKNPHGSYGHLMWVDNGVIYQISGVLERDTIIKIAESIY